jgi:hypothetical protein
VLNAKAIPFVAESKVDANGFTLFLSHKKMGLRHKLLDISAKAGPTLLKELYQAKSFALHISNTFIEMADYWCVFLITACERIE